MSGTIGIFPGQGSQYIGMGVELYNTFAEAREVFQAADEAISYKLGELILNGEEGELTLTANAQPAIMTVSMAVWAVLRKQSGKTLSEVLQLTAGHSLGEYSALCAAEALNFQDALRLVRLRGEAMQNAVPVGIGGMAALVGTDSKTAGAIAAAVQEYGVCEVANDNGAGQIVLSGSKRAIEKAIEIAPQHGVRKAIMLAVSAPFHSSLMAPAADVMKQALQETTVKQAAIPVISNVTAKAVTQPDEIRSSLVEQITGMVRWHESMELAVQQYHATTFVEIGPGKVLTGIAKRLAPDAKVVNLLTPQDIEQFLS